MRTETRRTDHTDECRNCRRERTAQSREFGIGHQNLHRSKQRKNPLRSPISENFWSEWPDSNRRPQHPKCRALPTALHPDCYMIVVAVMVKHVVKSDFLSDLQGSKISKNQGVVRVFSVSIYRRPRNAHTLPNKFGNIF